MIQDDMVAGYVGAAEVQKLYVGAQQVWPTLGPPPDPSPEPEPGTAPELTSLVFLGDFETGNDTQFAYRERNGSGPLVNPAIVTSPIRQGTYAGAYQCSAVQYRCENVPNYTGITALHHGETLWYSWSVRFPTDMPVARWQLCGQWHQIGSDYQGLTSPPIGFAVKAGEAGNDTHWYVGSSLAGGPGGTSAWWEDLGVVPLGEWIDVVVRLQADKNVVANNYVEVWVNGVKEVDRIPGGHLVYPGGSSTATYFKVGYYRQYQASQGGYSAPTTTNTVYFDNVRIGTAAV